MSDDKMPAYYRHLQGLVCETTIHKKLTMISSSSSFLFGFGIKDLGLYFMAFQKRKKKSDLENDCSSNDKAYMMYPIFCVYGESKI